MKLLLRISSKIGNDCTFREKKFVSDKFWPIRARESSWKSLFLTLKIIASGNDTMSIFYSNSEERTVLARRKTGCKDLCSFVAYNFQIAEGVPRLARICSDVDCSILQGDKFELLCPLTRPMFRRVGLLRSMLIVIDDVFEIIIPPEWASGYTLR